MHVDMVVYQYNMAEGHYLLENLNRPLNVGLTQPAFPDQKCSFIKCSTCFIEWHTDCSNLTGASQTVAKKLESTSWQCPWCFKPSIQNPNAKNDTVNIMDNFTKFISNMSKIEKCNDDLNESITAVQFFNQHIRHLLIDDSKFVQQTNKIDKLSSDVTDIKEQLNKMQTNNISNPNELIISEINELKKQLAEFASKPAISNFTDLEETITKLSSFPIDEINRIGKTVDALSQKVNATQLPSNPIPTSTSPTRPNTSSPFLNRRRSSNQICEPFTKYQEDVIPLELKSSLKSFIEEMDSIFTSIGNEDSRNVLYFGEYSYRYPGGEHPAKEIPDEVQKLIECIRPSLPNPDMVINSCLVSKYATGDNFIPAHRDDEPVINPESDIITFSIGTSRTMKFVDNSDESVKNQILNDNSLLVSSRFSQDFWRHSIEKCDSNEVRYSFTLRHVDPHFINSTIVLGDSNATNLKFGSGLGTLGAWMPGKQVKTGHIEAIPDPSKIGPYRNIVIHTGVNSINSQRFRKSNTALIKTFESKIRSISEMYPKARIFVSLLLPSKSVPLNYRIRDFNNLLLDLTCRLNRVFIIEHSMFGDILSDEHG